MYHYCNSREANEAFFIFNILKTHPAQDLNIDTSPEKTCRWQISVWKEAPHHMSWGNCKLKQQWQTTPCLLQGPKSRTLTAQILVGGWSNRSAHSLLVGMQNVTFKDGWTFSYKTKHSYHAVHQLLSLVFTQMSRKLLSPHKNPHMDVCISFVITAKTWKLPRWPSEGEQRNKLRSIQTMDYY